MLLTAVEQGIAASDGSHWLRLSTSDGLVREVRWSGTMVHATVVVRDLAVDSAKWFGT